MMGPSLVGRRWLKRFAPRAEAAHVQLLCFHHAGGSTAMYRHWPRLLPSTVEPIGVQLPGRQERFTEPPYDHMRPLIRDLVEVVKPVLDYPFACYGASMGARVAWALAHELRERHMPMPLRLFVAGSAAPSTDTDTWPWENRSDGLEGYVRDMGGTPAEVLAEPKLLAALLPTLQADLNVLSTHHFHPTRPLTVPIRAFAGTQDVEASPQRTADWKAETTGSFDLDLVPGGHFFDAAGERQVTRAIGRDLSPAQAPPSSST